MVRFDIRKKLSFFFLLLIGGLLSSQSLAHQKKEAITRVIFNSHTANIEIIHRFSIHDAEHASKKLFGSTVDIIGNSFSQKHFADYVNKNFKIKSLSDESLNRADVGFEIDGRNIWIYQESPLILDLKGLTISHGALREIWPEQVNLVNIERNKKVRSLVFKGSNVKAEQKVVFGDD